MRWVLFGILVLVSQSSHSWYPEYGIKISGVGSYDTTARQPILIAFSQSDNCESASIWLDGSLYNHTQSGNLNRAIVELKVDGFQSLTLSFDISESEHWLPRPWVLRQNIPADLLRQVRLGNTLTISIDKHKYIWNLSGSNLAIKSAYKACVE